MFSMPERKQLVGPDICSVEDPYFSIHVYNYVLSNGKKL